MKKIIKGGMVIAWLFGLLMAFHSYTHATTTYDGDLGKYLQTEKTAIDTSFDTTYDAVYAAFAKTGLTILKSVEYQGLVCMGAIQDHGLLAQLQKDATNFTISFNKDFVELEKRVLGLEQKKRIQDEQGLIMFDAGTTYESEKAKLKEEIDVKAQLYRTMITTFASTYTSKTTELMNTFQQYLAANQQLLQGIKNKMAKVQSVIVAFADVEVTIGKINGKITGLDDVIKKIESEKNAGLSVFDTMAQKIVATNIKRYARLQSMLSGVQQQKTYVLGLLNMDLDEYITTKLQQRYNRAQYVALKKEVNDFTLKYYSSTNQLNCTNFISATDMGTTLLPKIAAMKNQALSGLAKVEREGVTSAFKDQLYSGFTVFYTQKFKQRYAEYQTYLKSFIVNALRKKTSTDTVTSTASTVNTGTTEMQLPRSTFTRAFKSGQYHNDIKVLQQALTALGLYTGTINGIYDAATKEAVYRFQLSKGLLKGYENKPDVRGYFGPATRAAMNNLTK